MWITETKVVLLTKTDISMCTGVESWGIYKFLLKHVAFVVARTIQYQLHNRN